MIYGSVCSGIEAATAAWHPLGWRPAWFCEIDAFPSAVLAHHHPEVPNHGDFTRLLDPAHPARHGALIDVLVGGTPCQSFSHAGGRAGLDDPRGQLMLRYLNLVGALRPRWVVWENVPGVLSSGGGRDFGSLLGGLADLGYGVAYRVLDARYFGVPQRRRRVFLIGHSGGDPERAARVLALDEGVRGHLAARGKARKEAAAAVGGGAAVGGEQVTTFTEARGGNDGGVYADGTVPTLRSGGDRPSFAQTITSFTATMGGNDGGAYSDGTVATLRDGHGSRPAVAQTITSFMASMGGNHGSGYSDGTTPGLRGVGSKTPIAVAIDCVGFQSNLGSHGGNVYLDESITLKATGGTNGNVAAVAVTLFDTVVRRLTPRECERLQGFPDDHTLIPWKGRLATDGHRYKALGNSMAVPVMRWIGERIGEEDKR